MSYEKELVFLQKLLARLNIRSSRFFDDDPIEVEEELREVVGIEPPDKVVFKAVRDRTVYFITNAFCCCYNCLRLPESGEILFIGPYLNHDMTDEQIMAMIEQFELPPSLLSTLRHFYSSLTLADNDNYLGMLLNTFGETVWGNADAFEVRRIEYTDVKGVLNPDASAQASEAVDIRVLERRYEFERRLIHAVANGQSQQAHRIISRVRENALEQRVADPVRNFKNYAIVLNVLMRKAAEQGGVHPLHIDRLSSSFVKEIERLHSTDGAYQLLITMVADYCRLVVTRSMKHYSPLVQHVILRIETDLMSDLSLKTHAEMMNVNASYLSTLFRREVGMTLTEFVNRKRAEHAAFLLGATELQVQAVAQYCGVPDVNYFSKLFKRIMGKTPKEYRQGVYDGSIMPIKA